MNDKIEIDNKYINMLIDSIILYQNHAWWYFEMIAKKGYKKKDGQLPTKKDISEACNRCKKCDELYGVLIHERDRGHE